MNNGKNVVNKRVARYSLILETNGDKKYYYDFDMGTFVGMDDKTKPAKATLEKIDFLTANYDSQEQFLECYDIKDPKRLMITYQFNGEKKLAPVFNNTEWALLAKTYRGDPIDFKDYNNLFIVESIYNQILKLNEYGTSDFGNFIRSRCNISLKTNSLINVMVAHERATRNRFKYLSGNQDLERQSAVSEIYRIDKDAFKQDFRKRMENYRELRTVYLNYCRIYKNNGIIPPEKKVEVKKTAEKKLVKEQKYKQLSMFD